MTAGMTLLEVAKLAAVTSHKDGKLALGKGVALWSPVGCGLFKVRVPALEGLPPRSVGAGALAALARRCRAVGLNANDEGVSAARRSGPPVPMSWAELGDSWDEAKSIVSDLSVRWDVDQVFLVGALDELAQALLTAAAAVDVKDTREACRHVFVGRQPSGSGFMIHGASGHRLAVVEMAAGYYLKDEESVRAGAPRSWWQNPLSEGAARSCAAFLAAAPHWWIAEWHVKAPRWDAEKRPPARETRLVATSEGVVQAVLSMGPSSAWATAVADIVVKRCPPEPLEGSQLWFALGVEDVARLAASVSKVAKGHVVVRQACADRRVEFVLEPAGTLSPISVSPPIVAAPSNECRIETSCGQRAHQFEVRVAASQLRPVLKAVATAGAPMTFGFGDMLGRAARIGSGVVAGTPRAWGKLGQALLWSSGNAYGLVQLVGWTDR